jgi:hypothetical protein
MSKQKMMILRDHDEIEFESDKYKDDEMPPLKDYSE